MYIESKFSLCLTAQEVTLVDLLELGVENFRPFCEDIILEADKDSKDYLDFSYDNDNDYIIKIFIPDTKCKKLIEMELNNKLFTYPVIRVSRDMIKNKPVLGTDTVKIILDINNILDIIIDFNIEKCKDEDNKRKLEKIKEQL